eukprot:maker-scaffold2271_size17764-snap-gene-0.2 protein:Tk12272 transcript:maker-scaffold2271_size17764-snap-gene-0.2-mRNA-1 annotation:"xanthine permease"
MKLLYELNDRPSAGSTFLLALQHMLASIGGIIAVPLIVGGAIGLPAGDIVTLINAALFVSGAFTIVQCLGVGPVGIRLPVVMGSSFAFLGIAIGIVSTYAKGGVAASAIVIGLAGGYLVALSMGMVNLDQLHNSSWFAAPEPLKFGLSFSWPAIIGMCLAYIVVIAEATGDFLALANNCHRTVSGKDLKRGLLGDGIGSAVGSFFGAMPLASFSQNVGIVGITGVASRFVVGTTGALLILAGLFPKFGALAVSVPKPVLGGVGFIMFGMIAYAGIRMLVKAADTRRNALVICVSLAAGLAVTIKPSLLQHLHHDIAQLLHSGITTGTIVAVMLNLVLPKSKEDVTAEREAEEEEMNSEYTQPLSEETAEPAM